MSSDVEIQGQSGAPVLLLPGGAESVHGFFPGLVDGLVVSPGCRVILYDRPGTGSRAEPGRLADAAAHLGELIHGLGCGPVVVVGQSLGGAVALLLAAAHPDVVAGLVLLDPTPINDVKGCTLLERVMTVARWMTRVPIVHGIMQRQLLNGMRRSMAGKELRPECSAALDRIGNLDIARLADSVAGIGQLAREFRAEAVPRVPTVFVTADRKPGDSIRRAHEQLADGLGVALVSWPNAAHNLQLDHPDETLDVVRALVERASTAA